MWRAWPAVPAEPRHRPPLPLLSTHASHAWRALQVPSGWSAVAGWSRLKLKWEQSLDEVELNLPFHLRSPAPPGSVVFPPFPGWKTQY